MFWMQVNFIHAFSVASVSKDASMLKFVPKEPSEVLHWDYFNANNILFCTKQVNCPRHNTESYWKAVQSSVISQVGIYQRSAIFYGMLCNHTEQGPIEWTLMTYRNVPRAIAALRLGRDLMSIADLA